MAERSCETTRKIAHVLPDAVSGWAPGEDRQKAVDLALQRMLDLGGVTVTRRADGEVEVDVSPVIDGATLTLDFCDLVGAVRVADVFSTN